MPVHLNPDLGRRSYAAARTWVPSVVELDALRPVIEHLQHGLREARADQPLWSSNLFVGTPACFKHFTEPVAGDKPPLVCFNK